jgi:hypothetical protein
MILTAFYLNSLIIYYEQAPNRVDQTENPNF